MKKKIAVILIYKLNLTDYNNLNFEKLKSLFDVTFFDLSEIFLKNQKKINAFSYKVNSLENKIEKYYILKRIEELKILKNFNYILDFSALFLKNSFKKNKIKNFLTQLSKNTNSKKITILTGTLPNFFHHNLVNKFKFIFLIIYLIFKYKNFIFFIFFFKKIFAILNKNIRENKNINTKFYYDYVMVSDIFWENFVNLHLSKSKKIYIHYKDYEKHLFFKNTNKFNFDHYVTFLDEDIFHHPDFFDFYDTRLYKKKDINNLKLEYYSLLNNFFNNFERETGYKVIIAAHPKTTFTKNNNYFNNRNFIKNKTFELIKKSSGVFAHSSSSLSIAILLNKPITLLFDKIMFNLGFSSRILSMFFETKARLVDMNSDQVKYSDLIIKNRLILNEVYIKKYIKHPAIKKDCSMWDNLLKNLV
jgi:hypothetical protein